ncbi:MAG TPA: hypothetical protein VJX73_13175 [Terracidiphilus sp.]|nr:hypothetical protein [Terracidiphilus sp.]
MIVVYCLKDDKSATERVRHATRTTENFGIEPTHGMYGSEEWWQKIESGELPTHTLRGTISKVYMASMGDWPEFKMAGDDGHESTWTRLMHSPEQDRLYRVGSPVEIDFVWQQHRPKSFDHGARVEVVLEIRIEDLGDPNKIARTS